MSFCTRSWNLFGAAIYALDSGAYRFDVRGR
jgi:hypothetical protein